MGEDHGNEQGHAFRLSLIRDSRFAATVNDIVVEFGNARYQALMDRFMRGESVGDEALRHVWQDTTQISGVWDRPIYEAFFQAVRAVNAALPPQRQLRVLLADLPVDWDAARRTPAKPGERRLLGQPVQGAAQSSMDRDRYAAGVVRDEVLAKQRRALIIFGSMHVTRRANSVVGLLENDTGTRVFNVRNVTRNSFAELGASDAADRSSGSAQCVDPPKETADDVPTGDRQARQTQTSRVTPQRFSIYRRHIDVERPLV